MYDGPRIKGDYQSVTIQNGGDVDSISTQYSMQDRKWAIDLKLSPQCYNFVSGWINNIDGVQVVSSEIRKYPNDAREMQHSDKRGYILLSATNQDTVVRSIARALKIGGKISDAEEQKMLEGLKVDYQIGLHQKAAQNVTNVLQQVGQAR